MTPRRQGDGPYGSPDGHGGKEKAPSRSEPWRPRRLCLAADSPDVRPVPPLSNGVFDRAPLPQMKSNRSAAKRFKVTSTGKLLRHFAGKAHLLRKKRPQHLAKLRRVGQCNDAELDTYQRLLLVVPKCAAAAPNQSAVSNHRSGPSAHDASLAFARDSQTQVNCNMRIWRRAVSPIA